MKTSSQELVKKACKGNVHAKKSSNDFGKVYKKIPRTPQESMNKSTKKLGKQYAKNQQITWQVCIVKISKELGKCECKKVGRNQATKGAREVTRN